LSISFRFLSSICTETLKAIVVTFTIVYKT
jgi:hypothetical protein